MTGLFLAAMILIKPAYDADASSFFTTAGVTSTAGRQQISRFVTGIKDLGLWNSMVCWPLRSSQNAGTGTTAYSLGGLGNFNGTITNGTWLSDGLSLATASNSYVSMNWVGISNEITAVVIHKVTSITATNKVLQIRNTSGGQKGGFWSPFSNGQGYWDCINESTARTSATLGAIANQFFSHIGIGSSAGISHYRDGANLISSSVTAASFNYTPNVIEIGRADANASYTGTVAFLMLLQQSSISALTLHNLYKTTLGQGLGLP